MVAKLTYGVRKFEQHEMALRKIIPVLHKTTLDLIPMIDADTNAFNDYVEAVRLPQNTEAEKAIRFEKMQAGLKKAIEIPLTTMRIGDSAWEAMLEAAKIGNIASKSDIQVGARALELGIWGAWKNVLINMKDIQDADFINKITKEADDIRLRAEKFSKEILENIEMRS